jgi:hypothetical protein
MIHRRAKAESADLSGYAKKDRQVALLELLSLTCGGVTRLKFQYFPPYCGAFSQLHVL